MATRQRNSVSQQAVDRLETAVSSVVSIAGLIKTRDPEMYGQFVKIGAELTNLRPALLEANGGKGASWKNGTKPTATSARAEAKRAIEG